MNRTQIIERRVGHWMRARLPHWAAELVILFLKMGWAALFGLSILIAIIGTKAIWSDDLPIHRYDALLIIALTLQALFLWLKLETWEEARVILLFHLTGTAMEWFKVNAGSWSYPEPGLFKILDVPLFSGFMYASVGSFMARAIRVFDMRFAPYPPVWMTFLLATLIYVNFFAHHFLLDIRIALFAATLVLFWRTRVWYRVDETFYWMPLPLAAFLSAIFLWIAENIGTFTGTWAYSGQFQTELVSPHMLGSWYLLLYVSFVTVTVVVRRALIPGPLVKADLARPEQRHTHPQSATG
ncbi:MAG: DUF817 domain-containing protein [Pseudomonadota bacterium]